MYIHTKLLFKKRDDYVEVCVYYSRHGIKFRETTGVKVLHKHITKNGDISVAHPYYQQDLAKVGEIHDTVEALVAGYIADHQEKPTVAWLQKAYESKLKGTILPEKTATTTSPSPPPETTASIPAPSPPLIVTSPAVTPGEASSDVGATTHINSAARAAAPPLPVGLRLPSPPALSNENLALPVMAFWQDFVGLKETVYRGQGALNRMKNAKHSFDLYQSTRGVQVRFSGLSQIFFNDYVKFMAEEQEYFHNVKELTKSTAKPSIGLNNNTTIKRLTDLREYLKYCIVIKEVALKLDKIDYFIDVAKKRGSVRPMNKDQRWELTLDIDELEFVVNLDYYESEYWDSLTDNQKRYLDILVFMCLHGTNPSDTQALGKKDIQGDRIIGDRSKTFNQFNVELDPVAEAILIRNNYDLRFTPQTLGDELKRLFVTIFELYRPYYEKRTGIPYQMICRQQHRKGNKTIAVYKHRGLFMEPSTGRKTYATIMNELKSRKELMKNMGHTKSTTTEGYIHKRQQFTQRQSAFGIIKKAVEDRETMSA